MQKPVTEESSPTSQHSTTYGDFTLSRSGLWTKWWLHGAAFTSAVGILERERRFTRNAGHRSLAAAIGSHGT